MSLKRFALCSVVILSSASVCALGGAAATRISRPGEYRGFSPVLYDGWRLSSTYVTVRDGTRIAIDVIRPTAGGQIVDKRLPVVWMNTPYNRRPRNGKSAAETYPGAPLELVKHGYVIAVADFRGLYASFGRNELYNFGEFIGPAWYDAYDVTEWLARQPWSSGKIGMWGCSATGGSQLQAAATRPPALKAIFPLSPDFDAYEFQNYGGVSVPPPPGLAAMVGTAAQRNAAASPVDGPDGLHLLREAIAGHNDDLDLNAQSDLPFRDSRSDTLGPDWWKRSSPSSYMAELAKPGLGIYAGGDWDELATKVAPALLFANMPRGRAKLIFGPYGHCGWKEVAAHTGLSIQTEELRFFDYWLKGIHNGVMTEPAVTYYTYNAPPGTEWRQSPTWPLRNERRIAYYLSHGRLGVERPGSGGHDETTMGEPAATSPIRLTPAGGGIAYQTAPLEAATQVTGYPVARLWISADAADADVVAEIADVAPDGTSRSYQMVGRLRASQRKLAKAPYDDLDLPYHGFSSRDAQALAPGVPVELQFAMMPMSYIFPKGHRIRVTITFSNPAHPQAAAHTGAAVWFGPATPSSIVLPIIPPAHALKRGR
jgi:putative CocE/NonD family hydrolase